VRRYALAADTLFRARLVGAVAPGHVFFFFALHKFI